MALVNNGVEVTVNTFYVPSGYSLPNPSVFATTGLATWSRTISVDRATVQDADEAVTFGNILNDNTVGIKKQAGDLVSSEMDVAGYKVTIFTDFYEITTNIERAANATNAMYTADADAYLCGVHIYAKVEPL